MDGKGPYLTAAFDVKRIVSRDALPVIPMLSERTHRCILYWALKWIDKFDSPDSGRGVRHETG
jgi:hypothetical protein